MMQISNKQKDDLYYLCYVVESLSRKTKNRRNIEFIYKNAEVMHCESIDSVCYDL